ncbi:MAG: hypothetical protein RLZZ337_203 [Bacteroidota bacterium]
MPNSPYILLLETSGEICSVALARGEEIIRELSIEEPNSHSTHLASMVDELLTAQHMQVKDLDAVAISGGPGSYTGLRIGCSLAKGLCFGANIPLIDCSTLRALASTISSEGLDRIIPVIDARRMDAYIGIFDPDLYAVVEEQFVTLDDAFNQKFLQNYTRTMLVGNGAEKWANAFSLPNVQVSTEIKLLARHLLSEAYHRYTSKSFADLAYYEPNYIKSVYVTQPKRKF